jgi:hypothetical protein
MDVLKIGSDLETCLLDRLDHPAIVKNAPDDLPHPPDKPAATVQWAGSLLMQHHIDEHLFERQK